MKPQVPFIQLPLQFDATKLAAEMDALGPDPWREHPNKYPGNFSLPLIAVDGGFASDLARDASQGSSWRSGLERIASVVRFEKPRVTQSNQRSLDRSASPCRQARSRLNSCTASQGCVTLPNKKGLVPDKNDVREGVVGDKMCRACGRRRQGVAPCTRRAAKRCQGSVSRFGGRLGQLRPSLRERESVPRRSPVQGRRQDCPLLSDRRTEGLPRKMSGTHMVCVRPA